MQTTDLMLENSQTNQMAINDGDFIIADDLNQRVTLILDSEAAYFKQYPILGARLKSFIASNIKTHQLASIIKESLAYDLIENIEVITQNQNFTVYQRWAN